MNDAEINNLIAMLPTNLIKEFAVQYKAPVAPGSGHSIEIKNKTCLGTISVWAAGTMDWHIFDIVTSAEILLGHSEVGDVDAVRATLFAILKEAMVRDSAASKTSD
jgi:membrane protease subunit (stomatin/prohibitin family)